MSERSLLNSVRLPARIDVRQAAELLGFQEYEIPVLIKLKLLKPLGSPAPNGHKWFSTCVLLEISSDERWLARATDAVGNYFRQKNAGRGQITDTQAE